LSAYACRAVGILAGVFVVTKALDHFYLVPVRIHLIRNYLRQAGPYALAHLRSVTDDLDDSVIAYVDVYVRCDALRTLANVRTFWLACCGHRQRKDESAASLPRTLQELSTIDVFNVPHD
jgi:hypothetical protein